MCCLRRQSVAFFALIVTSGVALISCTTVPDLEPVVTSIPIYKIVERVKCEVLGAVKGPLDAAAYAAAHKERSRYAFLEKWTAKVDLTLIVNDQSGISPTVALVDPLPLATIPNR
jgi:hypothetical protein